MKLLLLIFSFFMLIEASEFESRIIELEKKLKLQKDRLRLSSEDTTFSLGGTVIFDAVLNRPSVNAAGGTNTYDYYLTPQSLTSNSATTKVSSQMKRSRLWFKTQRNTEMGPLNSLIEVDFYGSSGNENVSNSHNLRLRHAYLSLNAWTVGQTYSTFMGNSMPDLFLLSSDLAFVRQPMIKYTFSGETFKLDLALENPETTLLESDTNTSKSYNDDTFFDVVTRVRYESKNLQASLSMLLRSLSLEQNGTIIRHQAWGVNSSVKYNFQNNDYLQASLAQGEGIGRYLALGYFSDAEFNAQNINLIPLRSGHLSYTHKFSKKWRSTFIASMIETQSSDTLLYTKAETMKAGHINLRYTPVTQTIITLEYIKADKKRENQERLHHARLVLSLSYLF